MDPLFVPAPKPYSAYAPVARPPRRPRWATAERDDALPQTPAAREALEQALVDLIDAVPEARIWWDAIRAGSGPIAVQAAAPTRPS